MENRISKAIEAINFRIEMASSLYTEKIDANDYQYIKGQLDMLELLTGKKYGIKSYKVVEIG